MPTQFYIAHFLSPLNNSIPFTRLLYLSLYILTNIKIPCFNVIQILEKITLIKYPLKDTLYCLNTVSSS